MRRLAPLPALACAAALAMVTAPPAGAAIGDVSFVSCFSHGPVTGCADLSGTAHALDRADGPVMSPDGRHIYTAGIDNDAIARFDRDPQTGSIEFGDCWAASSFGCTALGATTSALDGVHTLALSPDGRALYGAALDGDALLRFSRDPGGELELEECFGPPGASDGCTDLPVDALDGAHWVRASHDGESVYAAGELSDSLVHFSVDPADGGLEFVECHAEALSGCAPTTAGDGSEVSAIDEPHWLALSADGGNLYANGLASDSVASFERDEDDGTLTFAGCISQTATGGCTGIAPVDALDAVHAVEVSPDGRHVYTAALGSSAVAEFARDPAGGQLTFAGCRAQGAAGCTDVRPAEPLGLAHSLGFSRDGRSLYAGGIGADALAHFRRDPGSGALTLASCIGQGAAGCADVSPAKPFDALDHTLVSPDGADVYVTAAGSDTISTLRRELPSVPAAAAGAAPAPPEPAGTAPDGPRPLASSSARISRRSLVLGRGGRVSVLVSCRAGALPCRGTLTLRRLGAAGARRGAPVKLGARRFAIPAGRSARIPVRLSRRARAHVRRVRRVRVQVAVRLRSGTPLRRTRVLRARRSPRK